MTVDQIPTALSALSSAVCPQCHIVFWGLHETGAGTRLVQHLNFNHDEAPR